MSSVQPIWVTPAGSLGTVPEGIFYQVPLIVSEPGGDPVYYRVIAGSLPTGIVCDSNTGVLTGIPSTTVIAGQDVSIQGVDITSRFAIRAYTTKTVGSVTVVNRLVDRTFTITVAGQTAPEWITPPGELGEFFVGELLSPGFQLAYQVDALPGVTPVTLIAGQLPTGLTINDAGLISGFIQPNPVISVLAGFSRNGQGFDQYGFDFNTDSPSYNYEFILRLNDGRTSQLRTFSMFVWTTSVFNASTTEITADNTFLTASISSAEAPVLLNPQGSIGTVRNDNYFAYQFIGSTINTTTLGYVGVDLPPGLELNAETGWLFGTIPNLGLTELTYDFSVRVYDYYNPSIISSPYLYSLTTVGPISTNITWLTPSYLGSIDNGSASEFYVAATNTANLALQYQIKSGSNSRLPQGLTLLPSGNIVGRVSFDNFSLDNNTTIFDNNTTTFDLSYTFTVNAFSANGLISVNKTFTIRVNQVYGEPYNNLYIECMPPYDDRALVNSLLLNTTIFPPALIYRNDDPNFGVAKNVVYNHAYGLTAATIDAYVEALVINHYWKNLVLGNIKTAQALDALGNVIYEVVYSEVIDNLVNNDGQPVGKEVVLPYPVDANTPQEVDTVFPNALDNMRVQVIDSVGQVSNILPQWMTSKQADGRVLGFTPAWVIAYVNPGAAGQVAYNIEQNFGTDRLNLVDFKADRYELDRSMTVNWDPDTISLNITNIVANGTETVVSFSALAAPFNPGDMIKIAGVIPTIFNGTFYVTSCTSTQVTFNSNRTGVYVSGGTVSSTPRWIPHPPLLTTFDRQYHYQTTTQNYSAGGTGYAVGNIIKVLGTAVGGTSPENDVMFVVNTVSGSGAIISAFCYGTANMFASGNDYADITGINVLGTGVGALWDITVVPGIPTVFDGNSMQFVDPSDITTNTDAFDRYLLYPRKDILTLLPTN